MFYKVSTILRTVVMNRQYSCRRANGACQISKDERYLCRLCRYNKCLQLGMTPDSAFAYLALKRYSVPWHSLVRVMSPAATRFLPGNAFKFPWNFGKRPPPCERNADHQNTYQIFQLSTACRVRW
ncbi:unnamed protein product [Heligmosomoides polygyrus]|uniref:Nuclear receptor domain-containing protein n=1 Tax=Heligmosomoides polygyrus TaxID=6339 RepID=A0A183FIL3_HELPZ|nr:unnamed protein product [Heligmosomoides polygyrus]